MRCSNFKASTQRPRFDQILRSTAAMNGTAYESFGISGSSCAKAVSSLVSQSLEPRHQISVTQRESARDSQTYEIRG